MQTTIDTDSNQLPRWLRDYDYVKQFVEKHQCFRQKHPNGASSIVHLKLREDLSGRSVLFWATKPQRGITVPDAKEAYDEFKNSGVSYVKQDGSVDLKLRCPSIYSAIPYYKQKKQTFPRHVHWVVSNRAKTAWEPTVYTTIMICGSSKAQVGRAIITQSAFVVNALSQEYHNKLSIDGTCSLGHERIAALSSGRVCGEVITKMKKQVPMLVAKAQAAGTQLSDLPIILYCAHKECNAAKRLAGHLLKAGFTNLYYYKAGLVGWFGTDLVRQAFS